MNDVPTGAVRVWPASEETRAYIRHPNGTRFRKEMGESVEWPNDSFTKRRIADGTVRLEGAAPAERAAANTEGKNVREVAEARRPKAQGESQPQGREPASGESPPRRSRPPQS